MKLLQKLYVYICNHSYISFQVEVNDNLNYYDYRVIWFI